MNADLDGIRTRARLAADKWRELARILESDIPMLIAEIEQLHQQLAAVKRSEPEARVIPPQRDRAVDGHNHGSQLLNVKQFAKEMGITEACVRSWTLERRILVVKVGRLVRIPRTEVQRLIDEGTVPVRPSRANH